MQMPQETPARTGSAAAAPPVTADRRRERAIRLLDRALATELVCLFRHRRHYCLGKDIYPPDMAESLRAHVEAEARHVDAVAARLVDLGGVPDLHPATVARRSLVPFGRSEMQIDDVFLPELLEDDLVAGRIAADAYREMIDDLSDADPATCSLLGRLVETEEARAAGVSVLLRGSCGNA